MGLQRGSLQFSIKVYEIRGTLLQLVRKENKLDVAKRVPELGQFGKETNHGSHVPLCATMGPLNHGLA